MRRSSSQVNGQDVDHFAFTQKGLDWQIWIARGDKPLPLRVVIIGTADKARPQFEASLSWDVQPSFSAQDFSFTPPPGAHWIALLPRNKEGRPQ